MAVPCPELLASLHLSLHVKECGAHVKNREAHVARRLGDGDRSAQCSMEVDEDANVDATGGWQKGIARVAGCLGGMAGGSQYHFPVKSRGMTKRKETGAGPIEASGSASGMM